MNTAGREWAWVRARLVAVPRVWRRVVAVVAAAVALLVGAAVPAWAAADVPAALSWMMLTDSRGLSVWLYGMSLDTGGVTAPGKLIWSFPTELLWQLYRAVVVFAIWFIDWVMAFTWLDWIATPVIALSDALQSVVDQLGLGPLFLTILAAVAGVALVRGRFALGLFEVLMGCVVAAMAVGGLSNPVGLVTGDSGYIMQSRDLGIEISAGLANNGDTTGSPDELRTQIGQTLVDTFVRTPHALVNYGRPIAGDACEQTYDDALQASEGEEDPSYTREQIADCDEAMGDYAADPNAGMAMSALVLTPASVLVLGFALLLCGALLMAAARVLYESLKLVVTLVTGILPGNARTSLWQGLGNLVMALATMTFTIVFLTGYLLVLQSVFGNSGEGGVPVMATFVLVDVLIVVGAVLFWRARKRLQEAAARLASLLATRPGAGSPSRLPAAAAAGVGFAGAQRFMQHRMLSRNLRTGQADGAPAGATGGDGPQWAGTDTPGAKTTSAFTRVTSPPRRRSSDTAPRPDDARTDQPPEEAPNPTGKPRPHSGAPRLLINPAGGKAPAGNPAPPARPSTSPAVLLGKQLASSQVKKTAKGMLVRAAVHAAAATSTGGLSTVVTAADAARTAHKMNNVRRAVVAGRLAKAIAAPPAAGTTGGGGSRAGGSVMPAPNPQGGYEQVRSGGQTILVPPRPSPTGGHGGQLPSRPSQATSTPSTPRTSTPSTPRTSPAKGPAGPTMPAPAPTPPPTPAASPARVMPAPAARGDGEPRPAGPRPGPPRESADQLHAHLRAFRGSRRRRDGA